MSKHVQRCEDNDLELEAAPGLLALISDAGYSPSYGARPLRRAVQRLCEDAVATAVLDGFVRPVHEPKDHFICNSYGRKCAE